MERLDSIRHKLERLASLDRGLRLFGAGGAHGHGYRRKPPLTAPAVTKLEESLGVPLPAELRQFLTTVHGGGAGPGYGFHVDEDRRPLGRRARPFAFDEIAARSVIARRLDGSDRWAAIEMPDDAVDDDDEWPPGPGFVPIAHHGCGVFDVVVVAGAQRGLVWSCDVRWCPAFDPAGRQLSLLDWYELWLDSSLERVERDRW